MPDAPRSERHPAVAERLDELRAEGQLLRAHQFSVAEVRRQAEAAIDQGGWLDDPQPVGRVREYHIAVDGGEIPVRLYTPTGSGPFPTLIWLHGGGWVRDTIDGNDPICRGLVQSGGFAIVSVGYRLAPDYPFPVGLEDCYRAVEWTAEHRDILLGTGEPIAVGGKSAGGNLTVATVLLARDRDGPEIAHQASLVPVLDRPRDTESYRENTGGFGPTPEEMEWFWHHYVDRDVDSRHPYAAPLQAKDLSGLPPATVLTAGHDALRDDGVAYVERLDAADVDVHHLHYPDMPHHVTGTAFYHEDIGRSREAISAVADRISIALGA
ncbi:MAG: alpha/beta hydrolase fold domain-containing protein [Salinirussus sp.]